MSAHRDNLPLLDTAVLVIMGHYGSGKTNLALNLANEVFKEGRKPTLVDLDVVNPYFRSTDFAEEARASGTVVLGPVFGNSNLDAPSLSPGISTAITNATFECPTILDVGGDPDGARALARYAPVLQARLGVQVIAVVNLRRPGTQTLEDNLVMLRELSEQSGLAIQGLVGNTHLAEFTTPDILLDSVPLLTRLSLASGIPLLAITLPREQYAAAAGPLNAVLKAQGAPGQEGAVSLVPVERLVKTVWQ